MMRLNIFSYCCLALFVPVFALLSELSAESVQASTPSAVDEVKKTIDEAIKVVEALPSPDQVKERREKLRAVIQPRFDFQEMSKRSLGPYWNEATPAQRTEFVDVFSELLARTYLGRIETVRTGMVKIDNEAVDFPKAVVKTTVTLKGDAFPIDYKLQSTDGNWRVYDVVIENIGLVANYRNEFAGIIRKEKISGLISRLKDKVQTLQS